MKTISYSQFGDADVLQMTEVVTPSVTDKTVLIKVKAVSINPLDWKIRNGEMKLMSGSKFPKKIGIDFSGVVEDTGNSIKSYKKGDQVFGLLNVFKGGALAEYIVAEEKDIAPKPKKISFEQAAAAPVVGSATIQIFQTLVSVQRGSEILINGGSGGIGMFAIQIAKMKGAIVTAVVSTSGLKVAKDWGSDFVIDYRKDDVLKAGKLYDIIIDLSNKMPYTKATTILKSSATYVHTAPGPKEIISSFLTNIFSNKKYKVLMLKPSLSYLITLTKYIDLGLSILVSKGYPFNDFKKAYTEVPKEQTIGKAVIVVGEETIESVSAIEP
ncbi:NAD(P)-dependent alcohol dehydrogenase [Pedobacter duraquae]|uniref:NADPH:quinone reductase-like Zn-dependent oxidoreductase n=1 Tax=Pedobacter duraquae TaxID=425511 RepID=A0A4R6IFN8_9SPHI|nr:NAD(P)-dependent alcohol dehydrogenase [Pedobacter duraquae]TDO20912.1 NADPH:quinone reductase-like Zn-dependent oxidoreductase [Pedobacter duraquae]